MNKDYLQIHPADNVLVALKDLKKGTRIEFKDDVFELKDDVKGKHKFTLQPLNEGDEVLMYGVLVGKTTKSVDQGGVLTTKNLIHASESFSLKSRKTHWKTPDVSMFRNKTFLGY